MHRPHFYIDAIDDAAADVTLSGDNFHHLRDVLRLRRGEEVAIIDAHGRRAICEIAEVLRDRAVLAVRSRDTATPPPLALHLAQALLQPHKMELIVQKATEWGVVSLTPVVTRRSRASAGDRTSRWSRMVVEAACQSESPVLLEVRASVRLEDFLPSVTSPCRFVFDEEGGCPLRDLLASPHPGAVTVLIGPEGGWERDEIEAARGAGFERVTLGRRNFRSETAAIAAISLVMHHWGMSFEMR